MSEIGGVEGNPLLFPLFALGAAAVLIAVMFLIPSGGPQGPKGPRWVLELERPEGTIPISDQVELARSSWRRFLGLMGRRELPADSLLWLDDTNSIHMLFMRFAIDAVFVDKKMRVRKLAPDLAAWWGVVWLAWGAHSVFEMPAGSIAAHGLKVGDQLRFGPAPSPRMP